MALGGRTVAELQAAMSSREFAGWMAYAEIAPFGESRADLRIATLAALLAEPNRDRKRRRKPYTVGEFVDIFRGEPPGSLAAGSAGGAEPAPDDADQKRAELWANLKAWAISKQDKRVN